MRPGFSSAIVSTWALCGALACGTDTTTLAAIAGCAPARPARAKVLSSRDRFLDHESRGARPGDVLIENAWVRYFITAQPDGDGYVPFPGWIIDADMARLDGEADYDGIDGYYPTVNVAPIRGTVTIESDGADGNAARVSVRGASVEVPLALSLVSSVPAPSDTEVTLSYALHPCSRALELKTTIVNPHAEERQVEVGDVAVFSDDEADPFSVPGGFDVTADLAEVDVLGISHEWRPATYAVYPERGRLTMLNGTTVGRQVGSNETSMLGYTFGSHTLRPRETLEVVRYLALAPDVSRALTLAAAGRAPHLRELSGRVGSNLGRAVQGARVSFFEDAERSRFVTQALSDTAGQFAVQLPEGQYYAVATGRGNGERVEVPGVVRELSEGALPSETLEVALGAERPEPLLFTLTAPARVTARVRDAAGLLRPAKLTFQAEDARDEVLRVAGERIPYASRATRQIAWTPNGSFELSVEPGAYTITASRGFASSVDVQRGVVLASGELHDLDFTVSDIVDLGEYVAIDSHMHGFYSQHGESTVAERVITAAAEGLHVHVATDHDRVADYGPGVARAGLTNSLTSIAGVELTTSDGHHNMWPLAVDPSRARGGAVQWWWGGTLQEWYEHYRRMGAIVKQVNHGAAYFANAGYSAATGTVSNPRRFTWDFNAMELHNAKGEGGRGRLLPIWFSLLNWGHPIAPVAVSDSHTRVPEAGDARTYVRVGAAFAAGNAERVAQAVAASRTVASTGLFIDVRAGNAGPGDTVDATSGRVSLNVTVSAPDWMDVTEVQLISEGDVVERWDATTSPAVRFAPPARWFERQLELTPSRDTWYVVQATGSRDLTPVYPRVQPWAITAPIFVDRDGDGRMTAPCELKDCSSQ